MANELVKVDANEYPPLCMSQDVKAIIEENLGGQPISAFNLDRIKVPGAGGLVWSVPSIGGDEPAKAIKGIIIYWKSPRVYWQTSYGAGEMTPPDCASVDGVCGVGNPGGPCADCGLNQWGSAVEGSKKKACKEMRQLFVLMPGNILPVVISLPPTSIGPISKFNLQLANKALRYWHMIVELTLDRVVTKVSNIPYSVVNIKPAGRLDPEMIEQLSAYREQMIPILNATTPRADEYAAASEPAD